MKWILLAGLLLLSAAAAQEATEIETDTAADVAVGADGVQSAAAPAGTMDGLDLLGLEVTEYPGDIVFSMQVADLDAASDMAPTYRVYFSHEDMDYRIEASGEISIFGGSSWAQLRAYDAGQDRWSYSGFVEMEVEPADGWMHFKVERFQIPDMNGSSPFPGRVLDNIYATAFSAFGDVEMGFGVAEVPVPSAWDRSPDTGVSQNVVAITYGAQKSGPIDLWSPDPFRASNGEATTFIYDIYVDNEGEEEEEYEVKALQVPSGWDVHLPVESIRLSAGEFQSFPVLVTTPFTHDHGTIGDFLLEIRSDSGNFAQLSMGVRFLEIPQPAGHHDTLYIHAEKQQQVVDGAPAGVSWFGSRGLFMNTVEDFEGAGDQNTPAFGNFVNADGTYYWFVELDPQLRLGLDFDLERTGEMFVPITTTVPLQGASMKAELLYYGWDENWNRESFPVATMNSSAPQDVNGDAGFTMTVNPTAAGDYLEYQEYSYLGLEIELTNTVPGTFMPEQAPSLRPGAWLQLPLNEYHDKLSGYENLLSGIKLHANLTEKGVNPGETTLFNVHLMNDGDTTRTFELSLAEGGNNVEWAELLTAASVTLKPGDVSDVSIAINVPKGVDEGTMADVGLQAVDTVDPTQLSVMQLRAIVTNEVDFVDAAKEAEAIQSSANKDASGLAIVAIVALIGMLAAARRK